MLKGEIFNEEEMITLCSEMDIGLIDNDESIDYSVIDNSLFEIIVKDKGENSQNHLTN